MRSSELPTVKITGEWDEPHEPDEEAIQQALMRAGVYDIDIEMDSDENPHGWGL